MFKIGLALLAVLFWANSASAYVGPGSGVELIPYAVALVSFALTFFISVLLWPLNVLRKRLRSRTKSPTAPPAPASTGETGADSNVKP